MPHTTYQKYTFTAGICFHINKKGFIVKPELCAMKKNVVICDLRARGFSPGLHKLRQRYSVGVQVTF